MGDWKHNGKIGVNRHQVQSKDSAARQERAIEKVTRQEGRDIIRALYPAQEPPCGAAVWGECDCRKCQGL